MRAHRQLVVAAVLSTIGAACGGSGDDAVAGEEARRAAAAGDPATYEVEFMTGMIDHHQMGIEMSEPCVDGATHPDLRALCEGIVTTQAAEIAQMREWLRAWYGADHAPSAGGMMMVDHLEALSGPQLEIAFMRMMIPHHLQAIRDASVCTTAAQHGELKGLCDGIVRTQSEEVDRMRGWLCEWYGLCGGGMGAGGGMGGGSPMGGGMGGRSR